MFPYNVRMTSITLTANIDANQRHLTTFWRKNISEINLYKNVDNDNEAYNVSK